MFPVFLHLKMPWERKPRRNAVEESKWISETYRIRWEAYKAIQAGGSYSIGDKMLYTSVRKRLKRMFQGNEEKLSRFRLLSE